MCEDGRFIATTLQLYCLVRGCVEKKPCCCWDSLPWRHVNIKPFALTTCRTTLDCCERNSSKLHRCPGNCQPNSLLPWQHKVIWYILYQNHVGSLWWVFSWIPPRCPLAAKPVSSCYPFFFFWKTQCHSNQDFTNGVALSNRGFTNGVAPSNQGAWPPMLALPSQPGCYKRRCP